jgi:hypothetical protein
MPRPPWRPRSEAPDAFWHDNINDLLRLFTQRAATSPVPNQVVQDFWAGVNGAAAAAE